SPADANGCSLSGKVPAEEGHDLARQGPPAPLLLVHERLLGLEQDLRADLHRAIDTDPLRVAGVDLAQELDDAPPDGSGDEADPAQPAFLERRQQPVGLTQLRARCDRVTALPGPEPVACDLEDGAFDH